MPHSIGLTPVQAYSGKEQWLCKYKDIFDIFPSIDFNCIFIAGMCIYFKSPNVLYQCVGIK